MINQTVLRQSLQQIGAEPSKEITISDELLKFHERYHPRFYRRIRNPENYDRPVYPFTLTPRHESFVLVGSDGSLFEALRPQFKNDFLITNTAVNLQQMVGSRIVQEDVRIYTRVHVFRDTPGDFGRGYFNLMMLYEELNGIARFIEEQKISNSIILLDGVDLTPSSYAWIKEMLGLPDAVKLDEIPFIKHYQQLFQQLKEEGHTIVTISSNSNQSYCSPVVQYNYCPHRASSMGMNCTTCMQRKDGYNYECETYYLRDATFFRLWIEHAYPGESGFFLTQPIPLDGQRMAVYLLSPYNWHVLMVVDTSTALDREKFADVVSVLLTDSLRGNGYPTILEKAHHQCKIGQEDRDLIYRLSSMYGLYKPNPKQQAK